MKYLLFISFTISTFVNATPWLLAPRQEGCPPGGKACGIECIPESWTCCHDRSGRSGGCAPGNKCYVSSSGVGGCCPVGKSCSGDPGPASTIDESEFTPTADPTTTIEDPTIATADVEPTITTESVTKEDTPSDDTGGNKPTKGTSDGGGSDTDNAGASNRLDNTVSYLLVGAIALLF